MWRNWGRTQSCSPAAVWHPENEAHIVAAVNWARARNLPVKVVGAGHSFTDIACTDGVRLVLDRHARVLGVDASARTARVQAGITLRELSDELAKHGLALENMGDIAYQTVAGATQTGTHGTGLRFGSMSSQVAAMRLVLADGSTLECSPSLEPDVFRAAQTGLGAFGVLSEVTIRCVDAYRLHAVEEVVPLEEALARDPRASDHYEFFWFPHTDRCLAKTNARTDAPAVPKRRLGSMLVENAAFGAVCRAGKLAPALIPKLAKVTGAALSGSERTDRSDHVFASPRLVRFAEMEYAVPIDAAKDAVLGVRDLIERDRLRVSFPVEVRFVGADEPWLSPAHGRDTCFVAVHVYRGMPYEPYFRAVEAHMTSLGGRPHWGKLHFLGAARLRANYPHWDELQSIRRRLDPEGRFRNAYLDRVLGQTTDE